MKLYQVTVTGMARDGGIVEGQANLWASNARHARLRGARDLAADAVQWDTYGDDKVDAVIKVTRAVAL